MKFNDKNIVFRRMGYIIDLLKSYWGRIYRENRGFFLKSNCIYRLEVILLGILAVGYLTLF